MIVLAGDVGGTKTRLGLYSIENRSFSTLSLDCFENKNFDNLWQIVKVFLDATDAHPRAAAFGIAGPVIEGVCKATNLPWKIDVAQLSKKIGIPRTTIVNDFVAHAHGIDAIKRKDLFVIQRGDYDGLANKALFGPGTGLGEAIIAQHGGDAIVVPSEGGHQDFAPQNETEIELLKFLMKKFGHVSNERILSGPGIMNVYEFLKKGGYAKESSAVRAALNAKGAKKPSIIMRYSRTDKLCRMTADLFFSVLGAEAGNLAMQAMAFGGVYIIGGLVRNHAALLKKSSFLKSFRNKGRLSPLMRRIPVYVVKNEKLGITGAAALASDLF
ncbi:MAG: glucokinase [Candidatus Woesearchaeota archaeon]